ncbi:MAG: 2-amino-4-hydroxy-6-hydroxymethyldihydropteridine diphosphokinase [Novosphingobium sp.]|nr:2-amino-4-hydroxy-6-hydroxymethyldihydropteridine diphosphokinase [Novosphingobium sp.]
MKHRYLIALGSNVRHARHGRPQQVVRAAIEALDKLDHVKVKAASPIIGTAAMGPSRRRFANAAAIVKTRLEPADLLRELKALEARFGRKRGGRRWGARVLDLDVVLWSGGMFADVGLVIPHPAFRDRAFVLHPALSVAPDWRDPVTGLALRHLHARLTRRRPARNGSAPARQHRFGGPLAQSVEQLTFNQ